jgi:hypothetical protein
MRTIILIWLLALIYCLLIPKPAHAGTNFTKLSEAITIVGLDSEFPMSDWSASSPIDQEFRAKLIEKINAIQKQFEEAEKASQSGLSKERLREIEEQAIRVLAGATVVCSSMPK